MSLTTVSENKVFGGWHRQYTHPSSSLGCEMRFAVYLPPQAADGKVPLLYWLSGLTCTDENFMQKAGAFRRAAQLGMAIVAPDTSPRGEAVPDDPDGAYDLGLGAGFYLNATEAPWSEHYRMYDYVVEELPALLEAELPVSDQRAISGHSMGGHGALMIALRNPTRYSSVSAFSPISGPSEVPWGIKAFSAYLGADRSRWSAYDSLELMRSFEGEPVSALVDQGLADSFLEGQLQPQRLIDVVEQTSYPLELRQHEGYDHSYYFISSFIEDHLDFHWAHWGR